MPDIAPFHALRYDPRVIPDLAPVMAPPYDVISPAAQGRYYERHPRNVVRLILPREGEAGSPAGDRYAQAARAFAAWQAEGILRRDPEAAIYLYEQEFPLGARPRPRRRGFLALMRLHPYEDRLIFPHEQTFSRHKDDRLRLMRACRANLEAILGIYPGPAPPVTALLDRHMTGDPAVELTDEDGIRHRLWLLTQRDEVARLAAILRDRPVVIADGHHRYETALDFRAERRAGDAAPPEVQRRRLDDFVLTNLVHVGDPGLVILPTHRVICRAPARAGEALEAALSAHFRVQRFSLDPVDPVASLGVALAELNRRHLSPPAFAAYAGGPAVWIAELKDNAVARHLVAAGHSVAYADLDVAVLHRLVIEEILGLRPSQQADQDIRYTRDEGEALAAVRTGEAQIAFFLNPPRVEQVLGLAMAGERLPQKSTFFFPKVLSGLVINPLDPEE